MSAPVKARWSDFRDADAVKAWESLSESDQWDTVFSTSPFLEAIAEHSNVTIEQITIEDAAGFSAAARLAKRPYFGIRVSPVPPLTAFSALRTHDALRESEVHGRTTILENLLHAVEQRFYAAAVHLPPAIQDVRIFSWRGWKVRPLYTYRIQFADSKHPLDSWSESARRIARQEASNFDIIATDAKTQAALVAQSYARSGRKPPLSTDQIASLVGTLVKNGTAVTAGARSKKSGEIEASVAILRRDREANYWLAGGQRGPGMTVLLASVLPDLASNDVDIFDFVGANTASIAEFKRKFGGQLTTYFRATWQRGTVGRLISRRV